MQSEIPSQFYIVTDISRNGVREIDFFYPSDGLRVRGALFLPIKVESPYPLLVFNHGGINGIYAGLKAISINLVLNEGFAVFAPSYRGEDGGEGEVEVASGEVDDVLNGTRLLTESPLINKDNVYMVGSSHGALITLIAMAKDESNLIKKGVFGYGVADIFAWWDYLTKNKMFDDPALERGLYPGDPSTYPDFYRKRNGLEYINQVKSPLLILQGEDDKLVPPEQAYILKEAFERIGKKDVKLTIIPGAVHGFLTERDTLPDGTRPESTSCRQAWKLILDFLYEID